MSIRQVSSCHICFNSIEKGEEVTTCPSCKSTFHRECWNEYGGCSIYGCKNAPEYKKEDLDEKYSRAQWGQEKKVCPYCSEEISIDTLECPLCHEKFQSAEPLRRQNIYKQPEIIVPEDSEVKEARYLSIALFIFSLMGCLSPFILILCPVWYLQNRDKIRMTSPVYQLLLGSSMFFSLLYVILIIVSVIRL
ncbi:MAG TPA: RING finger protein [Candidatus Eremiobacteraeota bacterium]|nr:RING finger protein [Candidatus Eremiobacteraeota bacterium]